MPELSKKLLEEFQQIMWDEYHLEMTEQEAAETAVDILNFFTYLFEIHLDNIESDTESGSYLT